MDSTTKTAAFKPKRKLATSAGPGDPPTYVRKRVSALKPSPENLELYKPIDEDDPELIKLANSIRANGLHECLVVTEDNFIVSGHRRHTALKRIDQAWVTCRVLPLRRESLSRDQMIALLRDHNRQRYKSAAEQVREELVDIDPAEAHRRLSRLRDKSVNAIEHNGVQVLKIEGVSKRYSISEDKAEHVRLIKKILEERRIYWPLTVRGVHYPLLNYDFIRGYYWPKKHEPGHGTRRSLKYLNDLGSYQATSDLLTRLRLLGKIPWAALTDGTRPLTEFHPFDNVREFVRHETERLFDGYWRNLLQTQPNYVEVVCEKNTIYHMVLRVTKKYQIFTSSGRGFNSIDPWHELYVRFLASGKKRLIVIILSDHDPEGERIPHVCGCTLRDDFGLDESEFSIVKAGVTRDQVRRHGLPQMNFAKESSSNFDWYVDRNGGDTAVWELEALDPPDMLNDLEGVIQGAIDLDLFNREAELEQEEAPYLVQRREKVVELLKGRH